MVYLDPPYWRQARGFYADSPENFANMELDVFHDTLANVIKEIARETQARSKDRITDVTDTILCRR